MNKNKTRHIEKYKILGKNIKAIRKERNLSQEELAFKLNTARNYIGCIERAEKFPSLAFIFDIKDVLECTLQDLLIDIK